MVVSRLLQTLVSLSAVLVGAQCVRFAHTNPPVQGDLVAPVAVKSILRRACYDCHSNETQWPWYSAVAPASWLIHSHIREGRRRLNFSTWDDYASDPGTKAQKLKEIAKFVSSGAMAPWYYSMLHPDARLTTAERDAVTRWVMEEAPNLPAPR